jgi:pyruvate/2-oxoglutarate dehydrogenase complex dihydrolipoamide dehydrogenase (E3) component
VAYFVEVQNFDVVVLGAGSAGEFVATTLAVEGKSVALVEESRVGGECAYLSCMPSKAMLRSGHVRKIGGQLVELGGAAKTPDLGDPFKAFEVASKRRDRIAEFHDDSKAAEGVIEKGVKLFRGKGILTSRDAISVDGTTLHWKDLVVSTGSSSTIPEIEGLESIEYWRSDQAMLASELPVSILIVGGGPVACELAQIFSRFGARTIVVEFASQLIGKEHSKIAERLRQNLEAEGVEIFLDTKVEAVELLKSGQTRVQVSTGKSIEVERVVIASGRHPNTEGIGLENLEIELDAKGSPIIDSKCRALGKEHIWFAGDVTSVAPFTHTANYQARIVSSNILGVEKFAHYEAIPRAVYTDPPVASVGKAGNEFDGLGFISAAVDLSEAARNSTDGDGGGLLILTADPLSKVLVGATAIGPHADEWMVQATIAIRAHLPLSLLTDVVHAFPTYGEAFEAPLRELEALYSLT